MSQKLKVELQDENGNIYYLHTAADVVFLDDGTTVEAALEKKVNASGGDISNTKLATLAAESASFPVPAAGDAPKTLWGKAKKWQQDCLAKFANYVLTSAITNQYLNDTSKIPTAALMYLLKQEVNGLNSDAVRKIPNASDLPDLTALMEYTEDWNVPLLFGIDWTSSLSPDGNSTIGIMTKGAAWAFSHSGNIYYTRESDSNPNEWKSKILTTLEYNDTPGDTIQDAIHAKAKFINQNAVCAPGILPGGWQGHEDGFTLFYKTSNIIILVFIGQYDIHMANYTIESDTISNVLKVTTTEL